MPGPAAECVEFYHYPRDPLPSLRYILVRIVSIKAAAIVGTVAVGRGTVIDGRRSVIACSIAVVIVIRIAP